MLEKVKRVSDIIENEIKLHKSLMDLLKEEQNILVNLKFENLEDNLMAQLDVVEMIKNEEDERIMIIEKLSEMVENKSEEMNIDTLLSIVEDDGEKDRLYSSKERLRELLRDIHKVNQANDYLIKNSLTFIEKNIKIILEGTDKEQFYGKTKDNKKNVHGKVLDWKV